MFSMKISRILVSLCHSKDGSLIIQVAQQSNTVGQSILVEAYGEYDYGMTGEVGHGQLTATESRHNDHIVLFGESIQLLDEVVPVTVRIDVFNSRYQPRYPEAVGPKTLILTADEI